MIKIKLLKIRKKLQTLIIIVDIKKEFLNSVNN